MCFSANVSFGAAALLIGTGVVTTFGNRVKEQRMIAAIPILFGVQQLAEGVVWQTLGNETAGLWQQLGSLLFIMIALVVSLLAVSVLYSVDVQAYPVGHSLGYAFPNFKRSWPASLDFLLYDIPTLVPFFVSSLPPVKKAGFLVVGGLIIAQVINREATTSVWCFFAALISFYIAANILWQQRGMLSEARS